jgi:hypothetical protein
MGTNFDIILPPNEVAETRENPACHTGIKGQTAASGFRDSVRFV